MIPEPVKVATALLLIALLLASMRRTRLPGEWLWLRDRFARSPEYASPRKRVIAATAAIALTLYLASGLFIVEPGEVGVRLRFGEIVSAPLEPGLHYRLPWPSGSHRIDRHRSRAAHRVRIRHAAEARAACPHGFASAASAGWQSRPQTTRCRTRHGFSETPAPDEPFLLTGDGNLINLRWAVQYRVKDAIAYAFNASPSPTRSCAASSLTALRTWSRAPASTRSTPPSAAAVEEQVMQSVQDNLDRTRPGVEMISFHLLYVHPPG